MSKMHASSFVPTNQSKLLLDTNILIHLFYPTMSASFMSVYEELYAKLLRQNSKLLLPAIQISEFINRCIRFQFELYKKQNNTVSDFDFKKDYRETTDYRSCMQAILDIVNNDILSIFTPINDNFHSMDQDKIYLYGFSYDFNDALLVQIAESQNAAIVTHDADFANYNTKADIITSNKRLVLFS